MAITEKLTAEGKRDFKKVLEWRKRLDDRLIPQRLTRKSLKHVVALTGEPT